MKIIDFALHQECPNISGIFYSDETMQEMHCAYINKVLSIQVNECRKHIDAIVSKKCLGEWNCCSILCRLEANNLCIAGGEGDWGTDGFIVVLDKKSQRLIWLIFCQESNPFAKISLKGNILSAYSTSCYRWDIPIDKPSNLTIHSCET